MFYEMEQVQTPLYSSVSLSCGSGDIGKGGQDEGQCRKRSGRPNAGPWVALVAITLAGLAIRLYRLDALSLWIDEGYSARAITHSFSYLWQVLPTFEFNPPTYYIVLKAWAAVVGDSEGALRLLSVVCNVATIPLIFLMARMPGEAGKNPFRGLLAPLLFALSSIQLQYAQEVRGYALFAFLVAVVMCCEMRIMRNWSRESGAVLSRGTEPITLAGWLGLGVVLALVLWVHNTGSFAALTLGMPLVAWWMTKTGFDRRAGRGILVAAVISAFLYLPYVHSLLERSTAVYRGYWIAKPHLRDIFDVAARFAGTPFISSRFAVAALFLLLSVLGAFRLWAEGQKDHALLLLSVGLGAPLLEIVVSYCVMPIFLDRTLIYLSVPLSILVGHGMESLGTICRAIVGVVVVSLLCANVAGFFAQFSKEPWRDVAAFLSTRLGKGEPVFYTNTNSGWALSYYVKRQRADFTIYGVPFGRFDTSQAESDEIMVVDAGRPVDVADADRVRELAAAFPRIGVVLRGSDYSDPEGLLVTAIQQRFHLSEQHDLGGIKVLIFDRS
ncbi:MAG TPA: hypothetical protein VGN52_15045 [Burkholderiales bacterium]